LLSDRNEFVAQVLDSFFLKHESWETPFSTTNFFYSAIETGKACSTAALEIAFPEAGLLGGAITFARRVLDGHDIFQGSADCVSAFAPAHRALNNSELLQLSTQTTNLGHPGMEATVSGQSHQCFDIQRGI
jgi:hypothetical protein